MSRQKRQAGVGTPSGPWGVSDASLNLEKMSLLSSGTHKCVVDWTAGKAMQAKDAEIKKLYAIIEELQKQNRWFERKNKTLINAHFQRLKTRPAVMFPAEFEDESYSVELTQEHLSLSEKWLDQNDHQFREEPNGDGSTQEYFKLTILVSTLERDDKGLYKTIKFKFLFDVEIEEGEEEQPATFRLSTIATDSVSNNTKNMQFGKIGSATGRRFSFMQNCQTQIVDGEYNWSFDNVDLTSFVHGDALFFHELDQYGNEMPYYAIVREDDNDYQHTHFMVSPMTIAMLDEERPDSDVEDESEPGSPAEDQSEPGSPVLP